MHRKDVTAQIHYNTMHANTKPLYKKPDKLYDTYKIFWWEKLC